MENMLCYFQMKGFKISQVNIVNTRILKLDVDPLVYEVKKKKKESKLLPRPRIISHYSNILLVIYLIIVFLKYFCKIVVLKAYTGHFKDLCLSCLKKSFE